MPLLKVAAPVTFGEPIAPFTKQEQLRALLLLLGQFLDRGITFHPSITINYKDKEQRRMIKPAFDEFSLWIEGDRENVT